MQVYDDMYLKSWWIVVQAEADKNPIFYKHICMDKMGEHYNFFNYDPNQSCRGIQIQPIFDQG